MFYTIKKSIRTLTNKNSLTKKLYIFLNLIKIKITKYLSDETFAKIKYKENTGKSLNINNPVTYNEKLWWLKLNNRDPLLTICSDKFEVREYIKRCGLDHLLIKLYGVYDKAEDIDFKNLPDKAFIKTNHGSGTNQTWDSTKSFNKKKIIRKFNKSLKENYYFQSREWNYKNIKPKIIIEEMLETNTKENLIDYKFFCFDGEVKFILVVLDIILPDGTQNPYSKKVIFDKNFEPIDMYFENSITNERIITKPHNFEKMIEYAEKISTPFPHCRVDLYNLDGLIRFGEITFYHAGGTENIKPEKYNKILGDWINLESNKIKLKEEI